MSFALSKLVWIFANPGNLFFLALAAGVILSWSRWSRGRRAARGVLTAVLVVAVMVSVLPFGSWLISPLEARFPFPQTLPPRADGVIVLGGAINPVLTAARGQPSVNGNVERLLSFVELARAYPAARLVFTGGSGNLFRQDVAEADGASQVFRQAGLDPNRVTFERKSRNTYENAVRSRELVQPKAGETWLLVTSARHMPGAVGVFRKLQWPVVPYPVGYVTTGEASLRPGFNFAGGLAGLSESIREWVGLTAYVLQGRSDSIFPGPGGAE